MLLKQFLTSLLFLCFPINAETVYVTADALFVREQADKTSKPLNLVPYGTSLEVSFVSQDWAQWSNGGFVSRAYLSSTAPTPNKKSLSLHLSFQGCMGGDVTTLDLSSGFARYTLSGGYEGGSIAMENRSGSYTVTRSGLTVSLTQGTSSSGLAGSQPKTQNLPPRTLELKFEPELLSFVTPEWEERVKHFHLRLDRKRCLGIYTDTSCGYGPAETGFGFYCTN